MVPCAPAMASVARARLERPAARSPGVPPFQPGPVPPPTGASPFSARRLVGARRGAKFLIDKLESSTQTHKELTFRLADPDVASDAKLAFQKLSKALGELTGVVEQYARYKACEEELVEAKQMVKDAGGDAEMEEMAREEAARARRCS